MLTVTQKMHNYEYAPGIATYGVEGDAGESGLNGNEIFYTDIDITEKTQFTVFCQQIAGNLLPVKNSTVSLGTRLYQNGDYFFTTKGTIYQLIDVDSLISESSGSTLGNYDKYLTLTGRISLQDMSRYIRINSGRVELNTSTYNGFDIIASGTSAANTDAIVNIVSDDIDGSNDINLVRMVAVGDDVDIDGKFLVRYSTEDDSYHIDTGDSTLLIESDVKIDNSSVSAAIDGYSTVMTSDDTILSWKDVCGHCLYSLTDYVDASTGQNRVMLRVDLDFTDDKYSSETRFNAIKGSMFFKVYVENALYCYRLGAMSDVSQGVASVYAYETPVNSYVTSSGDVQMVSGIYDTEIFLVRQ